MSIFGPCSPSGAITDQEGVDLSEYTKKSYVDTQDTLRVLKTGDTMSGDLSLGGHVARGLPTSYPPLYEGDEAVSWSQALGLVSDTANTRVATTGDTMTGDLDMRGNLVYGLPIDFPFSTGDAAVSRTQTLLLAERVAQVMASRVMKPIITIWAEENGLISNNEYEWSFGNGASGVGRRGYTMMAPGRILRMGLAATSSDSNVRVNLVVNGAENTAYAVTKPDGRYSGTTTVETPLELAQGDVLNFRSATTNGNITAAVVSLLIELDL